MRFGFGICATVRLVRNWLSSWSLASRREAAMHIVLTLSISTYQA
jgi:hypothetical protein